MNGLSQFTKNAQTPVKEENSAPPSSGSNANTRKRMKGGPTVALTVRLPRSQWEQVHQFATTHGVSIQELAVQGFAAVFKAEGLNLK